MQGGSSGKTEYGFVYARTHRAAGGEFAANNQLEMWSMGPLNKCAKEECILTSGWKCWDQRLLKTLRPAPPLEEVAQAWQSQRLWWLYLTSALQITGTNWFQRRWMPGPFSLAFPDEPQRAGPGSEAVGRKSRPVVKYITMDFTFETWPISCFPFLCLQGVPLLSTSVKSDDVVPNWWFMLRLS